LISSASRRGGGVLRAVVLGSAMSSTGPMVEVLSGLRAGDAVVVTMSGAPMTDPQGIGHRAA
jgi:hypothetical protein